MRLKDSWLIFLVLLFFLTCDESLPPRIVPQDTLEITAIIANQGANAGGIFVAINVFGQNNYEETFQDTVDVKGNIHIWWARKPEIEANVPLDNRHFTKPTRISGNILTLDPGEKFRLEALWYLNLDDGRYLINLLDFSNSSVINGIIIAKPEKFMVEVQLTLYEETGLLRSEPHEFIIEGWKIAETIPPE